MKNILIRFNTFVPLTVLLVFFTITSCSKQQDWLEEKVNLNSVVPKKIADFQALLDNNNVFQTQGTLGVISNGQFYILDAQYDAIALPISRNAYIWNKTIYEGASFSDWDKNYQMIAIANICLEGLAKIKITTSNKAAYQLSKGIAHYNRSLAYFNLIQLFAKTYNVNTANSDLGVPVRLSSDVNEKPVRSSIKACYDQIIADLNEAVNSLPIETGLQIRPSKIVAKGTLARVHLVLENWALANQFSTEALNQYSVLIDFNSLSTTATLPFPTFQNRNIEVLNYREMNASTNYASNSSFIDSTLYASYDNNDLRKTIFFRLFANKPIFKGFYTGNAYTPFGGLATNELYLIKAEALARIGNTQEALQTLNTLLEKRWRRGTFRSITANTPDETLRIVISERRKEIPFTGNLTWSDLKRLNKDPRFVRTLKRTIKNVVYELPPNSSRYVLPIPDAEIKLTGIPQNERE